MRFVRDLVLTAIAVCAVIFALEGGLRLACARYEASLYQPEDERGYSLRPNAEGWSVEETEVYVRINSDGMRDRERPIVRPPDTLRVAVVGASDADARQVPLEKTFHAVINRELSRDLEPGGRRVDVLNFGVPGYTLSQEYLTLRNHVWKYEPQVVIVMFTAFQVLKTTRAFLPGELKGAPVWLLQDGELVPDTITRNTPPLDPRRLVWKNRTSDWMNQSHLLCLMNTARRSPALTAGLEALRKKRQKPSPSVPADQRWRYDPDEPKTQESWAIAQAFLKAMKKECDLHGADFWIVVSELNIQVHPNLAERAAFQARMGLSSLDVIDRRLKHFGDAQSLPVLALSRRLGEYAASHGVFLHGRPSSPNEGHWNELGHEQVGHAIARELLAHSRAVRGYARAASAEDAAGPRGGL